MLKNLIIMGAGGAGLEALLVARRLADEWSPIAFVDDNAGLLGVNIEGLPVAGGLNACLQTYGTAGLWFHCAIGNNLDRQRVAKTACELGLSPATLIDPSVVRAPSAIIGEGTYVGPQAFIGPQARIGAFCLINVCASIGHHAELGAFAQVCPGGRLSGHCRLGEGAFVGSNGTLSPGVSVADWAILGANALAVKDVPSGATAFGVPARVMISTV
jgi:sugar O-acyltransferase (sialic acid O-acetyltransferase NeuD family)